ncbi:MULTISPECIES: phosphoenolpyruvate--protein phosphotransferase [unclassified Streptomyces]|uniref:phosphoenolpyruvate--protein phosphotransferase n=1 Tax=Streptomyces TaxID=1883 RepID=UPI0001C18BF5|nr:MULTISPECIES: phosphoenolpyruvate--protein phosphotransferase [unclassified Streptomyces]AEN08742.1 phosphoenolpyruvate-protein phosphotransferase [Streptomyces sp. SirexAA-E]MYR69585.1 phosphoenolpyruvate--protein phosphotransferase [Streptomyces sp. SID4939]MYS03318.1 phosphoenolpyruvate--protein phosphotransferase [Streptomyces sp. SID4940]MYT64169.1 phosphoenolpyruvate--protein phosphotransferase [Streptomyces sp. SID8357]MYT86846.1 phosphoenolpyruvate--protein phosphotransferase [Strep
METTLRGVGVSHGVAIGEVRHMGTAVLEPPAKQIPAEEAEREQGRARQAVEAVAADLIARGNLAGGEAQHVLEAQAMMAQDPELIADVERRIAVGSTAERGVYDAFAAYRALLANAGEYLAGRVADLDDVRNRIVARLLGVPMPGVPDSDEPYVLIARDLAPADTALLDPALVLGFVTEEGGPTSHSAILARALGVPAVVALPGAGEIAEGTVVAVDGSSGEVFVEPAEGRRAEMRSAAAARKAALSAVTGPGATSDGHKVPLLANVGGPGDVPAALEAGAEGVGLFRTEFLFLDDSKQAPSEEKQIAAYRAVLEAFPEGRVVVRVLDAGADKPLDFLTPADEPNPALGVRGLRSLLDHPDVLRTQLTALSKAAQGLPVYLEVMAPMVADRADAKAFADACREAGLQAKFGAMVEIPSAALRARSILQEVEFLSLGTNDLAQYTFAADRQVGAVSRLQDPWQPALLDLVALSAEAAAAEGKSCGVCGEAASDPLLACVLTGLGVTSLSMGAASIPYVRATLAKHTLAQCERAASAARAADSAEEARLAAQAVLSGE